MLLRSSSTPMLNSLINESPHHHHHHAHISCNLSSPFSDSSPSSSSGVRRTRSDGNLHSLLSDHHHESSSSSRRSNPMLESIPSLSVYNSKLPQNLEEEEEEEEEKDEDQEGLGIEREFSFSKGKQGPLFLARGLGIDRVASGMMLVGGGEGGCGEIVEMEMYYKKMVDEDPSNALVLRNYAKFLYEIKSDLPKAEEYYSRAILAEPGDGEILSQYAKLVWELHKDEERACTYFEQAIQASPHDRYY
ncbi:TPR-like protein [Dioscorea alata]|uniref:TPR-like protein n=1 Tax=Dioscorea alata TaxID=55571 RepID=A0ACB7UQ11_DIOAL|nr:TPR-like protein [Dioscorea alata]